MRKRLCAFLLTLALVFTYMPAMAFAEGETGNTYPTLTYSGADLVYYGEDFDGFHEEGNKITINYSETKSESFVFTKYEAYHSGELITFVDCIPEGEEPKIVTDEWGDQVAENAVWFDSTLNSETGVVTISYDYTDENGDHQTVSNDYQAKEYVIPVDLSYNGKPLVYSENDSERYVDLYNEGAQITVIYKDGSKKVFECKGYKGATSEDKNETYYDYFPEGEEPDVIEDDEGCTYARNAEDFSVSSDNTGKDYATVTYCEYFYGNDFYVNKELPISVDLDSKFNAFMDCAINYFGHELLAGDTEYTFSVPVKSYAEDWDVSFTKEDLDKVSITVETADGKVYEPASVKEDPDFPGDYLYTYKVPAQAWGAKFTIHYYYNENVSKDLKCAVKKFVNLAYSVPNLTYTGKNLTPKVTIKYGSTVLKKGVDYIVEMEPSTAKNIGQYGLYLYAPEDSKYIIYETKLYKVVPKGTTLKKLTKGKKSFTVTWNKQTAQTTGYQIQYSLKKNFKGAKTSTVKSNKTVKKTIKKLKKKKTYYVRIRTYKTVGKTNYYSAWSKAKKVKTK